MREIRRVTSEAVVAMDPRDIDRAIETATKHTKRAQDAFEQAVEEREPIRPKADKVVVPADDLYELSKDAVDEANEPDDEPK